MPTAPLSWTEVARLVQGGYGPTEEIRPGLTASGIAERLATPDIEGADLRTDVLLARRPERDLLMHVLGRRDRSEGAPGVLVIHGGGWQSGDHNNYLHMARRFAGLGWVSVSCTYRLSDEAAWPAQLDDVGAALDWMRDNAADLGLDPARIAVIGWSAGAHLAAMLALTSSEAVWAAVLYYPPCDLRQLLDLEGSGDTVRKLLAGATEDRLRDASPVDRIHAGTPPIFSITGDRDPLTPHPQVIEFHLALSRAGLENELHVLAGRTHGFDFLPDDFDLAWDLASAFLARRGLAREDPGRGHDPLSGQRLASRSRS